jgi:hypothetical protein
MTRQPVVSSNLKSVGYQGNTLEVEFNSGSVYQYSGVPRYIYDDLMSASSHGSYLANHVKGSYSYRQIS